MTVLMLCSLGCFCEWAKLQQRRVEVFSLGADSRAGTLLDTWGLFSGSKPMLCLLVISVAGSLWVSAPTHSLTHSLTNSNGVLPMFQALCQEL